MNLSIVIPSYNTQDTLRTTLTHVYQQHTSLIFEVIVVDCSPHSKVKAIAKEFPQLRFESRAKRFNPGEGRNIGAALAQGDLLMFIDADVRLTDGALDAAWHALQSGKNIFGGALELDTQHHAGLASYLEHYFFNHESQARKPGGERVNLSSALMCFKRELFLSAGGFKDIPRMQDTELTERLRKAGHKLYYCPDILAYQTQDSPFRKVLKKIYINGQNLYHIRYKSSMTPARKVLFAFLLPLIALAKITRIVVRLLRYQPWRNKIRTLILAPALLLGGSLWMLGFYHAILFGKGISRDR